MQQNVEFVSFHNDDKHRMNRHKLQHQTKNYSILIRKSFYLRERLKKKKTTSTTTLKKGNVENTNKREEKQGLQC